MATSSFKAEKRGELLDLAQRTILAVGKVATGKEGKAPIETDARTLLTLGEVMAQMLEDMNACGGSGCMGRTIDGTKLWVTQDQFEIVRGDCARLKGVLRQIAAVGSQDETYDFLIDWRETTASIRSLALKALEQAN